MSSIRSLLFLVLLVFVAHVRAQSLEIVGLDVIQKKLAATPHENIVSLKNAVFDLSVVSNAKEIELEMTPPGVFSIVRTARNIFRVTMLNPEALVVGQIGTLKHYKKINAFAKAVATGEGSIVVDTSIQGYGHCVNYVEFKQTGASVPLDLSKYERNALEWIISHPSEFEVRYHGTGLQVSQIQELPVNARPEIKMRIRDAGGLYETAPVALKNCRVWTSTSSLPITLPKTPEEPNPIACLTVTKSLEKWCNDCGKLSLEIKAIVVNSCSKVVRCSGLTYTLSQPAFDGQPQKDWPETVRKKTSFGTSNIGDMRITMPMESISSSKFSFNVFVEPATCRFD